jgi:hypothetical protein
LVSGRRGSARFVALGFDPRNSDLVLRVAWPLFILNTVHYFVEDDASYLSAYRTGEPWRIPVSSDATVAWLRDPKGTVHEAPVKEGRAAFFGERAGFYELRVGAPDAAPSTFAANLSDPEESRIEPRKALDVRAETPKLAEGFHPGARRELWVLFALFALALSVLEWTSYHRRITT